MATGYWYQFFTHEATLSSDFISQSLNLSSYSFIKRLPAFQQNPVCVQRFLWRKISPCHALHYCLMMAPLLHRVQIWEIRIPKGRYVCQTFSFKTRRVLTNFIFQINDCSLPYPNSKNKIHSNSQRATEPRLQKGLWKLSLIIMH